MNICLIGNGLSNLVLAKNLVKKKIKVDLFYTDKIAHNSKIRTLGISNENINFLKKIDLNINNISWPINMIKVFNELNQKEEFLNFNKKVNIFSIVKFYKFYNLINQSLKKENYFKKFLIKKKKLYYFLKKKNYDIIINSDPNNNISKKYFYNKFSRNYNSSAYTTIIKHKDINNNIASQVFTKFGPIAFLPISNIETSIVFSIFEKNEIFSDKKIFDLIQLYNKYYEIISFKNIEKFNLKFSISRNYYYKNILCFGDNLHKIHPLAGQGFNMTIRDIKALSNIIDHRLELGLPLDSIILKEFKNSTKHLNFLFAFGIDFIHDFFIFDNEFKNKYSNLILRLVGKNKIFNKFTSQFADKGLVI